MFVIAAAASLSCSVAQVPPIEPLPGEALPAHAEKQQRPSEERLPPSEERAARSERSGRLPEIRYRGMPQRQQPRYLPAEPGPDRRLFPWPPPRASGFYVLPEAPVGREFQTLADSALHLEHALSACGYSELSYLLVPDGFVVMTRLERIEDDGHAFEARGRWVPEEVLASGRFFSLGSYVELLTALWERREPGAFRLFAFVVTPHPFAQSEHKVSAEEAFSWSRGGLNVLPSGGDLPYRKGTRITALVYEFGPGPDGRPELRDPGTLAGRTHLQRAEILAALEPQSLEPRSLESQ
jgi:hypothetical protein